MAKVIKKKWMPYYWPIPLAEEEIPMDKGGFRSVVIDSEKVIKGLEDIQKHLDTGYSFAICWKSDLIRDAIDLLKEQEAKERKWLQTIADNQIANAPKGSPMSLDEQLESEYKSGIYDGLQMAFEILTEGR